MNLRSLRCIRPATVLALVAALCLTIFAHAQSGATGSLVGRVSNESTRQYLGEAEVTLQGTAYRLLTDRDGSYVFLNLPPGTYTANVTYTGLDAQKETVIIAAGKATKQDFGLTAGIYKMGAFTVASEVEGNAAAINQQKKANNFAQIVSADSLGEVSEGNIGEFLRYVPGLQVNYTNADASTVSMRGQDPDATLFTFDGQIPAAAGTPPRSSTGSSDASSRAYEFSQATISNIESIEIFKAPPPWMAPSTGGVINAVTKNAFNQKGRRVRTSLTLSANSEMLSLGAIQGPGQRATDRIKPGGSFNYSEALLHNTLGVSISYFESNTINPSHNYAMTYSPFVGGTAAVPLTEATPFNVNTFTLVDGPQAKTRRTFGLNTDYKVGTHTAVKLGLSYNSYLSQNRSHTFRVKPGSIDPASTTTDATIRNALVDVFDDYSDDFRQSYGVVGGVEHRFGPWKINYSGSYSKSDNKVADLPEMIQSVQYNLVAADALTVKMTANPNVPAPVTLVQTAGPDLYDLGSYKAPNLSLQTSPRFQNDRVMNLKADVTRNFDLNRFPLELRAGASLYQLHRRKAAGQIVLNFLGPDGIAGTGDEILPASLFNDTTYGDKFLYGIRKPPLLDPYKVAVYMKQNPLAIQDIQGTNIQRQAVNSQQMAQDVTAAYLAGTMKFGSRLTLMTGARVEETGNFVRGAIRINSLGVGLPSNSKQFFAAVYSQTQRVTSKYTDVFPNLQTTYRFTPDLLFRASLSRSMKRPDVQTILPNTTVNDTAAIPSVSVNNTGLLPSYSRNIDLQLEYYTRPAGSMTLGWFKKTVTNYIITETTNIQPGNDNGFDGQYAGYLLNTQDNGGKGQFEGLEASIKQGFEPYLKFLPEYLRGWEISASYTKFYKAEAPNRAGVLAKPLAPNFNDTNTALGLSYQTPGRRFYVNVRTTIIPAGVTTLATATDLRPVYESRHQRWDATVRYRLNRVGTYYLELNGSNLTDDSFRNFYQGGRNTSRRTFGKNYSLAFVANLDDLRIPFLNRE